MPKGNKMKTGLIIGSIGGVAVGLIALIRQKGVQSTVEDFKSGTAKAVEGLKAGTASAVEAVKNKKPIFKLVTDNADEVDEGIGGKTNDDSGLDDRAVAGAQG
jgi:hypothetical protein